jgi:hypothetical protein
VAKIVICPSCHAKGAIPDDAQVAKIRCPKCGTVHRIGGEAARGQAGPPTLTAVSISNPAQRRVSPAPSNLAGQRGMLYALVGAGGLVVVLLGVIVAMLIGRGDGPGGGAGPQPGANGAIASATEAPAAGTGVAPAVPPGEMVPPASNVPGAVATTSSTKVAGNSLAGRLDAPAPASPAPADVATPDRTAPLDQKEILRRLKDATVLINTKVGKKTIGNGSGFVIEVNGDTVLLGTNRHVAVVDLSEVPPGILPAEAKPSLEAVFRSGGRDEQALPAQIVAADLSGELSHDLAFLVVRGVKNPPKPLDPALHVEPIEGMSYLGAGFPLAGVIKVSENEGKPSVVVTGGRISSFKRDEFGQLLVLQVDGSLQPGNSGGPIIDDKTGRLLGVAVAKASTIDTIGFVVPADQVRRSLGGQVGGLALTLVSSDQAKANLQVKANLVDPKLQVAGVVIHAAPLSAVGKPSPNSDGSWSALPNTRPTELQRNPRAPEASGQVQVALSGSGANARKVWIQAAYRDMRGRLTYSRPKEVFLPDQPGPIRDAGSMGKIINRVRAKSLAMLGALVDPSKDCRLDKDEKSLKVRIEVPGKLHTLSPELKSRANTPYHNSPMTLAEVDGDFMAQVAVTGEISPGSVVPKERAVRDLPFTFQGAGLLLYQDKNNFIRLERAGSVVTARATPLHRLVVEIVRDGKQAIKPIYLDVPEGDTKLIMVRRKGRIRCMFGPSGSNSIYTFREFAMNFPSKVKVGLSATNISAEPFSANFEGFALLSDATQIDRELEGE